MADRTGLQTAYVVGVGLDLILIPDPIKDDEGTVVNLSNATLAAYVKDDNEDADAAKIATFTVAVLSAAAGTTKLTLPDTETTKLTPGRTYQWDLHVKLPANHATYPSYDDTPVWGTLKAVRPTTRATS